MGNIAEKDLLGDWSASMEAREGRRARREEEWGLKNGIRLGVGGNEKGNGHEYTNFKIKKSHRTLRADDCGESAVCQDKHTAGRVLVITKIKIY